MSFKLGECGGDLHVKSGTVFYNAQKISLGKGVRLGNRCDFYVSPRESNKKFPLVIGNHVHMGHRCTLACIDSLIIGNKVMIGNDVYIADHGHEYRNPDMAIIDQPVTEPKQTTIENESWIGASSIIMPGVRIGQHAVVGAGSIVTKDVEPFTVVVGNPAKMIKKYDLVTKQWMKI